MLKKYVSYLIYLTIFSLPFYIVRFQVLGIPLTILEVLILVTFGLWLIELLISRERSKRIKFLFSQKTVLILVIIFFISSVVSILVSTDTRGALGIWKAYILQPILFFFVLVDFLHDFKKSKAILYSLIAIGIMTSFVAIAQKITGANIYAPHEGIQGRVTGFFNSANSLSLFLAPITILVFARVLSLVESGYSKMVEMLWVGLFLILFLVIIFLTQSTGGMLGIMVAFGIIMLLYLQSKYHFLKSTLKLRFILSFGILLYLLCNIVLFLYLPKVTPDVAERPLVRVYDDTITVRLCLWEGTVNIIKAHPLLGVGLSGFHETYKNFVTCDPELLQYPHNLLLTFWTELGLLGVFTLFGLTTYGLTRLFGQESVLKTFKITSWWQLGLLGVFSYYLIHGLVDVPYFKNDLSVLWWIFLAFCVTAPDHQVLDQK